MSDISYYLNRKYAIQQQEANAQSSLANANASKINQEAGQVADNAAAQRAAAYGQADAAHGQGFAARGAGALSFANAAQVPMLAGAEARQRTAQAGLYGAEADEAAQRGNYFGAQAHSTNVNAALAPSIADADTYAKRAQGGLYGSEANKNNALVNLDVSPILSKLFPNGSVFGHAAGTSDVGAPHPDPHQQALHEYFAGLGYKSEAHHAAAAAHATEKAQAVPGHSAGISSIPGTPGISGRPGHAIDLSQMSRPVATDAPATQPTGFSLPQASSGFDMVTVPGHAAGTDNAGPEQSPYEAVKGMPPAPENYRKGTGKVAGKGDGTKDKTLSMLAPGEAVLNKAAADDLGRDTIDALNAAGAKKMGLDQQPNDNTEVPVSQAQVPGHKGGTSDVSSGKAPAKGNPVAGTKDAKVAPKKGDAPAAKAPPPGKGKDAADKSGSVGGKSGSKAPPPKGSAGHAPQGVHPAAPALLASLSRMLAGGGMPAPQAGPQPGPMAGPPPAAAQPPQLPGRGLI